MLKIEAAIKTFIVKSSKAPINNSQYPLGYLGTLLLEPKIEILSSRESLVIPDF